MKYTIILILLIIAFPSVHLNAQCITDAGAQDTICGNNYTFNATQVPAGYSSIWASSYPNAEWSDSSAPYASVKLPLLNSYNNFTSVDVQFSWTIYSDTCTATDSVWIHFIKEPDPNAGPDDTICDLSYTFQPVTGPEYFNYIWSYCICGSPATASYTWNSYPPDNHESQVNVSEYGSYLFVFGAYNPEDIYCRDKDSVIVVFENCTNLLIPKLNTQNCTYKDGSLMINSNVFLKDMQISIQNLQGKVVYNTTISKQSGINKIALQDIPSSIYVVVFKCENKQYAYKFFKP
ncbi:MAG: hypothetical protein C0594_08615 [Marinilabiliales bacterium]|nr:MAG: hypothetical protein C0594_08615 [Marinilabiliales bacterium]